MASMAREGIDNIALSAKDVGLRVVRSGHPQSMCKALRWYALAKGDEGRSQLAEMDVLFATIMSSMRGILSGREFTDVLTDEGAQATELSILVPILPRQQACGLDR